MFLSQWTDNGLNSQCCTLKGAWVCLMCFCHSPVTNYMGIAVTMLQNVLLHAILSAVGPHPLNVTLWVWVLHAAVSFVSIAGRWGFSQYPSTQVVFQYLSSHACLGSNAEALVHCHNCHGPALVLVIADLCLCSVAGKRYSDL